jgi:hypothetical protein
VWQPSGVILVAGFVMTLLGADASAPADRPSLLSPVIGGRQVEAKPRYDLKPAKQGGYEYEDTRFSAHIAPDGRVSFKDQGVGKGWRWVPFLPEPLPPGTETLESAVGALFGRRRPTPAPPPPPRLPPPNKSPTDAAKAPLDRREDEARRITGKVLPIAASDTLDVTDAYYRLLGEDPYRYEKARFLAATSELRLAMAARAQAADLRRALPEIPKRLAAIWADRSQPPAARRRLICGLWAELRQDDAARAGAAAVIEFVRERLPAGSRDAYSADELGGCNRGLAPAAAFAPYENAPGSTR